MNKKSKTQMPKNLTPGQQRRSVALEHKTPAFRMWKSRKIAEGTYIDDMDYVIYGYDLPIRG